MKIEHILPQRSYLHCDSIQTLLVATYFSSIFLVLANSTAGTNWCPVEDIMLKPALLSAPSTTHLVLYEDSFIATNAVVNVVHEPDSNFNVMFCLYSDSTPPSFSVS